MKTHPPVRLLVHGAQGKMGSRIAALARDDPRFKLIAALDREDGAALDALKQGDVEAIIDFSSPEGADRAAAHARRLRAALLVGTTGLSEPILKNIDETGQFAAVMVAANTSLGVAVLGHLVAEAARLLGPGFDVDMVEMHHTMKKDAPSGTALRLARAIREKGGAAMPAERIHCVRAGDIIGEHSVQFAGHGERITISHSATNRDLFARGALRAAAWLAAQKPGRYTIERSLGLA